MATATRNPVRVHVRWMIRRDMQEVLKIEGQSFAPDRAWTEDDFLGCLRRRQCIGMVAEHNDRVVGFMVYELQKGALRLLNLAVHPVHRHRGVGSQMVARLVGKLSSHRRHAVRTLVCERNLDAQKFFRRVGFRATGVVPHPWTVGDDDGYAMEYRLAGW